MSTPRASRRVRSPNDGSELHVGLKKEEEIISCSAAGVIPAGYCVSGPGCMGEEEGRKEGGGREGGRGEEEGRRRECDIALR
ncbi:hypothetical protein EYF80_051777 [Liparis tanakae]|uniref:Uncharacterized protein n=1 Tax=Liparis tanakae TaxID=230148 RepID=A0A4Z2FCE3_9TELE|nr:hypothetical protein EYF80_051777 [Liparis tanakae]